MLNIVDGFWLMVDGEDLGRKAGTPPGGGRPTGAAGPAFVVEKWGNLPENVGERGASVRLCPPLPALSAFARLFAGGGSKY